MSWPESTITEIDRETLDALAEGRVPAGFRAWCELQLAKMDKADFHSSDESYRDDEYPGWRRDVSILGGDPSL